MRMSPSQRQQQRDKLVNSSCGHRPPITNCWDCPTSQVPECLRFKIEYKKITFNSSLQSIKISLQLTEHTRATRARQTLDRARWKVVWLIIHDDDADAAPLLCWVWWCFIEMPIVTVEAICFALCLTLGEVSRIKLLLLLVMLYDVEVNEWWMQKVIFKLGFMCCPVLNAYIRYVQMLSVGN